MFSMLLIALVSVIVFGGIFGGMKLRSSRRMSSPELPEVEAVPESQAAKKARKFIPEPRHLLPDPNPIFRAGDRVYYIVPGLGDYKMFGRVQGITAEGKVAIRKTAHHMKKEALIQLPRHLLYHVV